MEIAGDEDMISISHESFSRKAFATGAMRASRFVYRKSGYYEMSDVLNLSSVLSKYIENDKNRQAKRAFGSRGVKEEKPETITS